uniref:Uncharacterized protein n=1 Tax=Anopheles funestus TaxID=62324 RepID=A0A182RK42_ANOFN
MGTSAGRGSPATTRRPSIAVRTAHEDWVAAKMDSLRSASCEPNREPEEAGVGVVCRSCGWNDLYGWRFHLSATGSDFDVRKYFTENFTIFK